MLEVILTLILVLAFLFIESLFLKLFLFGLYLAVALPGIYALMTGAPYLRTSRARFETMQKLHKFSAKDVVVDLGCGDGKLISDIADLGVKRAVGYEFSILTYLLAKFLGWQTKNKAEIIYGNFWNQDLSEFNVVFCFLLDTSMKRFGKDIWPNLNPGTIVLVNQFKIPGVDPVKKDGGVYVYVK